MQVDEKIVKLLDRLIVDGNALRKGCQVECQGALSSTMDKPRLRRWLSETELFKGIAGDMLNSWKDQLVLPKKAVVYRETSIGWILATLETVRYAIDEGLLGTYDDLLYAEAFGDLVEQGQHLLSQGYFLAAGVIFRAVLEERLRRLCEKHNCQTLKDKPTINDLNMSLYKADSPVYSKSVMMQVTALEAVGNYAVHNDPSLTIEDVSRLQNGLIEFLAKFSQ